MEFNRNKAYTFTMQHFLNIILFTGNIKMNKSMAAFLMVVLIMAGTFEEGDAQPVGIGESNNCRVDLVIESLKCNNFFKFFNLTTPLDVVRRFYFKRISRMSLTFDKFGRAPVIQLIFL